MELQEFDDSKGSDQGTGGIPLERLQEAKRALGVPDNPEDAPEVQQVLDREAAELNKAHGIEQPSAEAPEQEAAPAEPEPEAPAEAAEPAAQEAAAQEPEAEETIDPAVLKDIRKKYRGKFGKLTKEFAEKDDALRRSDERLAGLERNVSALARTVEDGLKRAGLVGDNGQEPQRAEPEAPKISREDWEEDPVGAIYKVSDYVTRQHNQALLNTIVQRDAIREQEARLQQKQEQLDYHKERINRIYAENPQRWEALPRDVATELLLDQAALLERAEETETDLGRVLQGSPARPRPTNDGARTVRGGAPNYAGLGAGKTPTIRPGAPGGAPVELRKTPEWKALADSRPDSEEEVMRTRNILKRMGYWSGEKG